jgi:hypothetical protein
MVVMSASVIATSVHVVSMLGNRVLFEVFEAIDDTLTRGEARQVAGARLRIRFIVCNMAIPSVIGMFHV